MASHRSISLPLCAARERQRQPLAPDVVGVARDVPRHRSTLACISPSSNQIRRINRLKTPRFKRERPATASGARRSERER
jgi:hypothetical protein